MVKISQNNKFNPLQIFKQEILAQKGPFLNIGGTIKWYKFSQKNKFNPLQFL